MYTRAQKESSSVSPTSTHKKSNGSDGSRSFSVQRQPEINSSQEKEIPSYSRNAADSLIANVMRSMEEGKDSDEMSLEAGVQTKLTVGAVGDKYEQEADQVAAQVMSMSVASENSPPVQRVEEEDNPVQRWSLAQSITPVVQRQVDEQVQMRSLVQRAFQSGGNEAFGDLEGRLNASKGGGSALAPEVRAFMEPRFGADFSSVRVHTGAEAVQLNRELSAQAFTHGSDVYFGAGKSPGNNELTAHELTHVVQQTGNVSKLQRQPGATSSQDSGTNSCSIYQNNEIRNRASNIESQGAGKTTSKTADADLNYYGQVIPAVINVAQTRGIPIKSALIIMAQAQAEHGKSVPSGNMIFGITTNQSDPSKVVVTKTWEVVNGKKIERTGKFKRFDSRESSVEGYLDFLSGKDKEFPNMYKSGQPAQILMESNADPDKFKEAMIAGGYSTNPNGFEKEITDPTGQTKTVHVPGYRQVFPQLYKQVSKDMKKVLPALMNQAQNNLELCKLQKRGYEELISEFSSQIQRSSDDPEHEKIRQDLDILRQQAQRLEQEIKSLEKKKKLYGSIPVFRVQGIMGRGFEVRG